MKALGRLLLLVLCATLLLQLFFVSLIAVMAWLDPESTSYQRSEAWQLAHSSEGLRWRQQWVDYGQISSNLKRAVIASEDAGFMDHHGVEWDAVQRAWQRNAKAEARAMQAEKAGNNSKPAKVYGGSTITQQLAKNLLLSGERSLLRKGQEFVLTQALELLLSKERILEIYLNSVEWGDGVFGAEAAAQHYYKKPAAKLSPHEAARLAVMLPRPKYFEKLPNSGYVASRAATIGARMGSAELP